MGATVGEKTKINPRQILDRVRGQKIEDVVVVVTDHKGDVRVYGSSGVEMTTWMMDQAKTQLRK